MYHSLSLFAHGAGMCVHQARVSNFELVKLVINVHASTTRSSAYGALFLIITGHVVVSCLVCVSLVVAVCASAGM